MDLLQEVEQRIAAILKKVSEFACWLLLPMIAVIMFDVVARKTPVIQGFITNTELVNYVSSIKLQELEWHLHTIVFAWALGWVYIRNRHVRVGLWRETKSEKTKAVIEIFGIVFLMLPFLFVVLFYGAQFVFTSYSIGEGSSAVMGLPHRWVIKGALLVGFILLLLAAVAVCAKNIRLLALELGDKQRERYSQEMKS